MIRAARGLPPRQAGATRAADDTGHDPVVLAALIGHSFDELPVIDTAATMTPIAPVTTGLQEIDQVEPSARVAKL